MKVMKFDLRFLSIVLSCLLLNTCYHIRPPKGDEVNLTPNDPRPVYSVVVEDGTEIALLEQQLKIEPISTKASTVYFVGSDKITKRLEALGYRPVAVDPYQVYERVVRVARKGQEEDLMKAGVKLFNREKDYWIVSGNLAQLIALKRIGYRIAKIAPYEPMPREVRVLVPGKEDVAWIGAIHVDIYSAHKTKAGIVVYGGAFDCQIDQMRDKNYKVEIVDTTKKGGAK